MSMGAYDEEEHERREKLAGSVDVASEEGHEEFHGSVTYDSGDSAEALLDQFERMKDD